MFKNHKREGTIVSVLLTGMLIHSIAKGQEFRVVESTSRGVLLEFRPQLWREDKIKVNNEIYWRIYFRESAFAGKAGEPQIPTRIAILGVPSKAKVVGQVVDSEYEEMQGIKLLPFPEISGEGLGTARYFEQQHIYQSAEWFPKEVVSIEKPGFFGDLKVVRVNFYPLQFNPQLKTVRKFTRLVLRVDFIGANSGDRSEFKEGSHPQEGTIYENAILNYDVAKHWIGKKGGRARPIRKKRILLQGGQRYKIGVRKDGIYKLDASTLSANGIDPGSIDPKTVKIYNNGGRELPRDINVDRPDSLIENAIRVLGEEDGKFDPSDYILFYGKAVNGWNYDPSKKQYSHYINHYADDNIYWLVFNDGRAGKRIKKVPSLGGETLPPFESFNDHLFQEEELENPFESGIEWYGQLFQHLEQKKFDIFLPGAVTTGTVNLKFRFLRRSDRMHKFDIYLNDVLISTSSVPGPGVKDISAVAYGNIKDGLNTLRIEYSATSERGQAYLDWFELQYPRRFEAKDDELRFYSPDSSAVMKYTISDFSSNNIEVYDITDFNEVKQITGGQISEKEITFSDSSVAGRPKSYIAVTPSAYKTPLYIVEQTPTNLRNPANAADLIIITHNDFYQQAEKLKTHRETWDNLQAMVVKVSDIYDEFSWGLVDPTAIRDFLQYTQDAWAKHPSYVLLLGDGDYDYKNIISSTAKNWVPPYEAGESVTDDWYTYVRGNDRLPDVAIGRITATSAQEAENVVEKIINYETAPLWGDWRNTVTIVGDDELVSGGEEEWFGTIHTMAAEDMAEHYIPRNFDLRKIYLSQYPLVYDVAGLRKPQAEEELLAQLNKGTLLVNFVGHGNEEVWAHERVLDMVNDFHRIQNGMKLALWIAATCSFGRFDMPGKQSMSEELLVAKRRGAIAVLASARLVYASYNIDLNRKFLYYLFQDRGQSQRLGDAMRLAKLQAINRTNSEMFHLFGDPAMRLGVPKLRAVITTMVPDSLQALRKTTIAGVTLDGQNNASTVKGDVLMKVFDSKKKVTYYTGRGDSLTYILPGNSIFRGEESVIDGNFVLGFIVPKDITYGGKMGRVSLYLWDGKTDGAGYRDSLVVGGTATGLVDVQGPDISLSFKGQPFTSGDYVGSDPVLVVQIADAISGVNITGEIGHKITLVIDGDKDNKKDLTALFRYDKGSYLEGSLEYALTGLEEGEHTAEVKAWDNANNSATAVVDFTVVSKAKLVIDHLLNYPNPFSSGTTFTFQCNHGARVSIKIYTLSGRLLRTLDDLDAHAGFNTFYWDGRDQDGDSLANGVYLYKVYARTYEGDNNTEVLGKLVVMR